MANPPPALYCSVGFGGGKYSSMRVPSPLGEKELWGGREGQGTSIEWAIIEAMIYWSEREPSSAISFQHWPESAVVSSLNGAVSSSEEVRRVENK